MMIAAAVEVVVAKVFSFFTIDAKDRDVIRSCTKAKSY